MQYGKNVISRLLTYRANALFKMINRLIFMAVQVYIWRIVYGNDDSILIDTQFGIITLHDMISYTVMSHVMYCFVQSRSVNSINESISNGNISQFLIRPVSMRIYLFIESLAESFVSFLFQSIPLLIFGIVLFNITIPSFSAIFFYMLFLLNGFLIYYLLTTIAAGGAFWVVKVGPINALLEGLIKIFSGVWIPIWFLEDWLLKLTNVFPLQNIYFYPIAVYLNKISGTDLYKSYAIQWCWIIGLFMLMNYIWIKGEKRIMIQGG